MCNKPSVPAFFILSFALLFAAVPSEAGETSVIYSFEEPRVVDAGQGFSRIGFDKTIQAGKAGEPSYPFRGVQILLPPGEAVHSVRIERRGWTVLEGRHKLYPKQLPRPGIERDPGGDAFLYNRAAYNVDSWVYPPESSFKTHFLRGHAIAVGSFSPVGYHPVSEEVGYYREVVVVIESSTSTPSMDALEFLRSDLETRERISRLVDNPSAVMYYGPGRAGLSLSGNEYEYLIITKAGLDDDFLPLKDFYTRRGMRTKIITVEEIEISYSGGDTAEKIRNAIISEYVNNGITHVLLGGDADGPPEDPKIVPYRGLYCGVQSSSFYEDVNIPSDLYFAALDGSWNSDGDSLWGEEGEEDFYSEIGIGRACVDSPDEISNFINKTVGYQEFPVSGQVRRALLLGEYMYADPLTYGGDELDQLVGTCTAYGFTTTGIPVDYDITKYYDRDMGSWSKTLVIDAVNAGTNWLHHAGHSNSGYVMRLTRSDVTDVNFTNDGSSAGFPIFYSYGCYAGSFDNRAVDNYESTDCIGELMVSISHCAVSFIGNSRYGWFTEGTTNGPSHHFQREFVDAVFTEGYTTLGSANQRSKDETAPYVDLPDEYEPGAHRWCFYTLNLLGDPALDGWTDTPGPLTVSHPSSINRSDTLLEIETGEEGSVASLYSSGVCYGRGISDGTGHNDILISTELPDTIAKIELNVCAHNYYTYHDSLLITDYSGSKPIPLSISLEQNFPNPFNPSTRISFTLPSAGNIDLRIYDVAGRQVDILKRGYSEAGRHTVNWRPSGLPAGVYFCVLRTGDGMLSRKLVLIR